MAQTAAERALALASQPAAFTNFVDFTSNLVENVFRTLVKTSREQLETYVDMVEELSGGPSQFIANHIGDLDAAAMKYLNEVVRPTYTSDTADYTRTVAGSVVTFSPTDVTLVPGQVTALTESFTGVRANVDSDPEPDELTEAIVTTSGGSTVKLEHLHAFAKTMLERAGRRSFDELQALLRIGLTKVVPNKGFIETALTFSIDTAETEESSSQTTDTTTSTRSRSFSATRNRDGQVGLAFKIFNLAINSKLNTASSSSRSSTNVRVNVINEKSTAATNLDIDITGRVRIDFVTDYFPLLPAPAPGQA